MFACRFLHIEYISDAHFPRLSGTSDHTTSFRLLPSFLPPPFCCPSFVSFSRSSIASMAVTLELQEAQ